MYRANINEIMNFINRSEAKTVQKRILTVSNFIKIAGKPFKTIKANIPKRLNK